MAAERIELASQVARVQQRMAAFAAVLESIGAQKAVLVERLSTADGATRTLIATQISILESQEVEVLRKVGVSEPTARQALATVDVTHPSKTANTYVREGRRFRRTSIDAVANQNGTSTQRESRDDG